MRGLKEASSVPDGRSSQGHVQRRWTVRRARAAVGESIRAGERERCNKRLWQGGASGESEIGQRDLDARRGLASTTQATLKPLAHSGHLCFSPHVACPPSPSLPFAILLFCSCCPPISQDLCGQHRNHVLPHQAPQRTRYPGPPRSMGLHMVITYAAETVEFGPDICACQPSSRDKTVPV